MHSDGLTARWDVSAFGDLMGNEPNVVARRLLSKLGRIDDDATIIVARSNKWSST
jgi:hypothetical protein